MLYESHRPRFRETRRNPKGSIESSRWSESAETTGKAISHDRTPRGVQDYWSPFPPNPNFQPGDIHCVDLAPLRGAIRFIIRSGGLRGLRPPATFFATLRVALRSLNNISILAKPHDSNGLKMSTPQRAF